MKEKDSFFKHTAPSFCELASKGEIANMAIRDKDLSAHVKYSSKLASGNRWCAI